MVDKRNAGTALVTGASSGIGAEFAAQLAARGHDLVLVARSKDRLRDLAKRLQSAHGVAADVIVEDLANPDAAHRISGHLDEMGGTIDLLVNNAGFGTAGKFEEIDGDREHDHLMVNVVSLVDLTHALIPGMLSRGNGAVVNVSSTAALQPTPYFAAYGAGKTFVLNFTLSLRSEYRGRGIRAVALCPGPTETSFFDVVGEQAAIGGRMMTAERVVRAGLRGLDRDRAYVVPGFGNSVNAHLAPRRPRRLVTAISKMFTRSVATASAPDVG